MANLYSIVKRDADPYVISNTTDSYDFTVSKRQGTQTTVQVTWSLNGTTVELWNGTFSTNRDFSISNTALLNALNNTGTGTMTISVIVQSDTFTATNVVNVDSSVFKTQFSANPTVTIQSTPIRGYLISGYSTARVSYSATKGTGASQMLFNFSVPYGISGSFNPSSDSSSRATYNGHTDFTINRRDTDISFFSNAEVTDSRGQSTDRKTVSTTWKGYTPPDITASIRRCDSGGNYDDSGEYVKIECSATYSLTNLGNSGSVYVTEGGNTYHNGDIVAQAVNEVRTYTVVARDTVLDSASETVTQTITVNMAKFPLDLYDDGRGHFSARVGAIAERGYFTCGLKQKGIYFYGTCATARGTARKVCNDVDQTFQLYEGVIVFVKFTNYNSVANPTLNVNGTGAIAIRRYGTTAPSTSRASSWNAGSVVAFIYDGTAWQMVGWLNTTYSAITEAEITNSASTTSRNITGQRFKQGFDYYYALTTGTMTNTTTTNYQLNGVRGTHYYYVKIGRVVTVSFNVLCNTAVKWSSSTPTFCSGLPETYGNKEFYGSLQTADKNGDGLAIAIQGDGTVKASGGTDGVYYYGSVSYISAT